MSNEEIKAPLFKGWEGCTYDTYCREAYGDRVALEFFSKIFYYRRIKPKEKSIREIIQEELKLWNHSNRDLFANAFERILENYVKKEG